MFLFRVIEEQAEDADDFDKYKAPYQAAECLICLPKASLAELLQDSSVIGSLFGLIKDKNLKKTYGLFNRVDS